MSLKAAKGPRQLQGGKGEAGGKGGGAKEAQRARKKESGQVLGTPARRAMRPFPKRVQQSDPCPRQAASPGAVRKTPSAGGDDAKGSEPQFEAGVSRSDCRDAGRALPGRAQKGRRLGGDFELSLGSLTVAMATSRGSL